MTGGHILEASLYLLILAGPAPAALCAALLDRKSALGLPTGGARRRAAPAHTLAVFLTLWFFAQSLITVGLGFAGLFQVTAVCSVEGVLFILGLTEIRRRQLAGEAEDWIRALARIFLRAKATALGIIVVLTVPAFALYASSVVPFTEPDSVGYHLPHMAYWLQTGFFGTPPDLLAWVVGSYPYGWEAVCAQGLLAFHEDCFVAVPNVLAWVLCLVCLYRIGRSAGAAPACALLGATLAITAPMAVNTAFMVKVDMPLAAFFFAYLYFGLLAARQERPLYQILFFGAAGMMLGIKISAAGYVFLGAAGVLLWRDNRGDEERFPGERDLWRRALGLFRTPGVLAGLALALLLAGPWYGRNWLWHGSLLGLIGTPGAKGGSTPDEVWRTTLACWFRLGALADWRTLGQAILSSGGVPWCVEILIALVWFWPRMRRRETSPRLALLALLAGSACLYWITPFSADNNIGSSAVKISPWVRHQLRFAFPFFGVLGVCCGLGASRIGLNGLVAGLLAAVSVSWSFLYTREWQRFAIVCAAVLGLTRFVLPLLPALPRGAARRACAAAALAVLALFFVISGHWRSVRKANRLLYYDDFQKILDQRLRPGESIAHSRCAQTYLLYGERIDRPVKHIPADKGLEAWLAALRKEGVRYVAVGPWEEPLPELDWIRDNPSQFRPAYRSSKISFFVQVFEIASDAAGFR